MKGLIKFVLLFVILVSFGLGAANPAWGSVLNSPNAADPDPSGGDMPGWPLPDKPIPHHEPGQPFRSGDATHQITQLNAQGIEETVELQGIDAMLADGTMTDPFQGNYRLVGLDKIMFGSYAYGSPNNFSVQSFELVSPTLVLTNTANYWNFRFNDIAAGDLNGDLVDEQIAAWIDPGDNHIRMSLGEMPGSLGRTTSAPAAIAREGASPDGFSLEFDGSNDYVSTGEDIIPANSSFTVTFWARRPNTGYDDGDYAIGQGQDQENHGLHIGFRGSNAFTCGFYLNDLDTPLDYTDTDWHYWACTYDLGSQVRTIYRDGVQVAQDSGVVAYQGDGTLNIGRVPWGSFSPEATYFDGFIDEVGVWNVARTRDRIQADMIRLAPDDVGLMAYWHFDEGSGTTTADASGNGHDGTRNGPLWNADNAPLGELHLLVRGYDEALWHCVYDLESGSCLSWDNSAGGILLSAPAVVSLESGQFDVFVIGTDYKIYQRHWDGGWSANWQQYADWPFDVPSWTGATPELPPLAVTARDGGFDLFRRGPDNTLFWYDGTNWESLGGMLSSDPGAVSLGDGRMQVYALGMDGALWYRTHNGSWGAWQRLQTPVGVAGNAFPVLTPPVSGQISIYLTGTENRVWSRQYNVDTDTWGEEWSSTTVEGGDLDLGIGAAVTPGGDYLFAQMADGSLQSSSNGSAWVSLNGLDVSQTFGTAAFTRALDSDDAIENRIFDITTGYFTGDGRQQVVLAYDGADNNLRLEIYDMQDGFRLTKIADLATTIYSVGWPRVAAGDVNGDGVDEIGLAFVPDDYQHYQVQVYEIAKDEDGNWTGDITLYDDSEPMPVENWIFAGTLRIEAGDIVQESDNGSFNDEFVVISDWRQDVSGDRYLNVRLDLYDDGNDLKLIKDEMVVAESASVDFLADDYTGVGLAVGNVDPEGYDEIIVTWPRGFHVSIYPRLYRDLIVYRFRDDGLDEVKKYPYLSFSRYSFLDNLAVGDLDMDLMDEVVMAVIEDDGLYHLDVYEFETLEDGPVYRYPLAFSDIPRAFNLAVGDFTGESIRVGPPSYRVQNRVDTLVTVINTPPKHRDLVKDSAGSYHEIVSPDEGTCTPTASDPRCTHAKYATEEFEQSQQTIQTLHAYAVSAGMENKLCASGGMGVISLKGCVTRSIDYTHGGNFEKTTDEITSIKYENTVIAASDDQLVYYGTPYAVWEYPVLTGNTGEAEDFITVAFPLISKTESPSDLGGYLNPTCNEDWYTPGHQLNNVWSYDPIGPLTFSDYNPAYEPIYQFTSDGNTSGAITYSNFESVKDSSKFNHKISASLKTEAEAKANLGIVNLEGSFKAHIGGSYENTSMDTDVFTTKDGTTYSFFIGEQPVGSRFQTRVVFYWGQSGYQVLNYQTEPGISGSWEYYEDIADPAFILPWYGFPDPVTGQFPLSPDPDAPPCGFDKQLFSPDVQVSPAYASVGETVVISATVRNFSNFAPEQPFAVKFYQGDPNLNILIGQDTITDLSRQSGPQTAHIIWTASGAGRQKIFAVIDPDGNLPEVHDENDYINNNVAFTILEIGSSTFIDQDVVQQQPYQSQSYSQSDDRWVSFYLPPGNLEAVSRFDLMDSRQSVSQSVGRPFELVAHQGSEYDMWDEPIPYFDLKPVDGSPPAAITVAYSDADIIGHNEVELNLYQLTSLGWEKANLLCGFDYDGEFYEVTRFPQDNLIAVPICQTGTFVLSDQQPDWQMYIYLPVISR